MTNTIKIIRGDTETINFIIKEEDIFTDITGWKCYFTVKKRLNDIDTNAVISQEWTSHIDPLQGQTQIVLSSSDTNKPAGKYFYDFQIKKPTGEVMSIQYGMFEIIPDITNRTT